jgi:hypothetical protein
VKGVYLAHSDPCQQCIHIHRQRRFFERLCAIEHFPLIPVLADARVAERPCESGYRALAPEWNNLPMLQRAVYNRCPFGAIRTATKLRGGR